MAKKKRSKKEKGKPASKFGITPRDPLWIRLEGAVLDHAISTLEFNIYAGPLRPTRHPNRNKGVEMKKVDLDWWDDMYVRFLDQAQQLLPAPLGDIIQPATYRTNLRQFKTMLRNDYLRDPAFRKFVNSEAQVGFWQRDIETELGHGMTPPPHKDPRYPGVDY